MQGLLWKCGHSPNRWFANDNIEPESCLLKAEIVRLEYRPKRVFLLGVQLAQVARRWLSLERMERIANMARFWLGRVEKSTMRRI